MLIGAFLSSAKINTEELLSLGRYPPDVGPMLLSPWLPDRVCPIRAALTRLLGIFMLVSRTATGVSLSVI